MNIAQAKQFFYKLHDVDCNQKYNSTLPYSFHLDMVEQQAEKFNRHIPCDNPYYSNIIIAIYGHDSIEDCRLTYSDIKSMFNEDIAEIIYLCTENKGKTRSERKDENWYKELATNGDAVFVKLCDIIANVKFSLLSNSSMFGKYKLEYEEKVKPFLYREDLKDMFDYLESLFTIKN